MLMKWEPGGFKSETSRARGLGSSRHGPGHWMHQRITAFANIFLMIWLVFGMTHLIKSGADMADAAAWLSSGINPVLMILAVLSSFYHAALGLQIVIEDYVHHEGRKIASLVVIKLVLVLLAAICIFSVLKVAV